jgi:hypothetical protein
MIDTTIYSSAAGPDVDNWAKLIYQDPGLISAIDDTVNRLDSETTLTGGDERTIGGGGDFENALAEMVNSDWMGSAENSMSDEEYLSWMENSSKKEPMLDSIGEAQASSLTKTTISVARNPMTIVAPLMGMLPHAALILLAASLAPLIIDEMKKPGSMLDVRWRRIMQEEFNAIMGRQDQWNAQIGVRQVYVASHDQFLIGNGAAMSESNLRRVRESDDRIADRIEFTDHALEFFR